MSGLVDGSRSDAINVSGLCEAIETLFADTDAEGQPAYMLLVGHAQSVFIVKALRSLADVIEGAARRPGGQHQDYKRVLLGGGGHAAVVGALRATLEHPVPWESWKAFLDRPVERHLVRSR